MRVPSVDETLHETRIHWILLWIGTEKNKEEEEEEEEEDGCWCIEVVCVCVTLLVASDCALG